MSQPPNRVEVFATEIETLDRLLDGGLPLRSIVLIAGKPGTGKTTLTFEILANAVKLKNIPVAFLTFDESPHEAYERYDKSYGSKLATSQYEYLSPRKRNYNDAAKLRICTKPDRWLQPFNEELEEKNATAKGLETPYAELRDCGIWAIDGVNHLFDELHDQPSEFLKSIRRLQRAIRSIFIESGPVDDLGRTHTAVDPRIVILTAEYANDRHEHLFESYFADVVIRLEQVLHCPDQSFPSVQESLLRCSIAKGRGIHIQRRSVSYEFMPGKGIEFYPTYPASGLLSLFRENRSQHTIFEDFVNSDVPSLFPGLSVRSFGREQLYHEYAIRRRERRIPLRFDMRLSSLDEYWPRSLKDILEPLSIEDLRPYDRRAFSLIDEVWKSKRGWLEPSSGEIVAVPYLGNVGVFVSRRDTGLNHRKTSDGISYLTWEDIESYCKECPSSKGGRLAVEMKLVDSFVAFMLEVCWSFNGGWYTRKIKVPSKKGNELKLEVVYPQRQSSEGVIAALERFKHWVHDLKIVTPYGTLEHSHPRHIGNWHFGRFWYSTLVDYIQCSRSGVTNTDTLSQNSIRVLPIPIPAARVTPSLSSASFHSAWGEWYLGVWKGSENTELAGEVINTMISSRWQINAAVTGAGLPLYEPFFDDLGGARCYGTDLRFDQIRSTFYKGAFSRGQFSEYRYAMQRFYAALMTILDDKGINSEKLWQKTVKSIESWRPNY